MRKVYKGEYSFSAIARYVRRLRRYGLLKPIGTMRGYFKPIENSMESKN